ncbi:MAG: NAD(+) diphosphatase [Solirubrobacteraceae bacterium]
MTDPNAFTGSRLDRAADGRRRGDAWLAAQQADPRARVLVAGTAGVAMSGGRLSHFPLGSAPAGIEPPALLGIDRDGPLFALDEGPAIAEATRPPLIGWQDRPGDVAAVAKGRAGLREAVAALPQDEGGTVAYAAGLLNWHRRNRFCSVCGTATVAREGGHIRHCDRCGTDHHPRLDPVVIMLVVDGDRVLLGRQRSWPAKRYSALAGFVSQGESLEEAVAREVAEEAGVEVDHPSYFASQPWPFPSSLMLGFTVPRIAGQPPGTDPELEEVSWFTRETVASAAERQDNWDGTPPGDVALVLPPRLAIARRLIEHWLGD